MDKTFYVYIYRDPKDNLPFYIGKGTGNRKFIHLKESKDRTNNYLKWCKIKSIYNREQEPIIEIYWEGLCEVTAYELEEMLIKKYGRKDIEDNGILTNRCIDARPPTYAASMPRSPEYLENMSKAKMGSKNPMYGLPAWNTGVPHSSITKGKISQANSGRMYSEEERKRRDKTRGKVYQINTPDGKTVTVRNLKKWCRENKIGYNNMRQALTGYKGKTSFKGYSGQKKEKLD